MGRYWLYLEPYSFLWTMKRKGLVYNSINSNFIEFVNDGILGQKVSQLSEISNMYCIEINQNDLLDSGLNRFVKNLQTKSSGGLLDCHMNNNKPVFLPPKMKLIKDVNRNIEKSIKSYLNEISIFINGQCDHDCNYCSQRYKQVSYCTKSGTEIQISDIVKILDQIGDRHLGKINILGGNILKYKDLNSLLETLKNYSYIKLFHLNYLNMTDNLILSGILKYNQNKLKILIHFPLSSSFASLHSSLLNYVDKIEWLFVVISEDEFNSSLSLIENFNLNEYEIKPIFTGSNNKFFEEYVFLNKADILKTRLCRRQLYQKEVINTFDFGKLTVFSDNKIYANLNHCPVGNIKSPIGEVILNEITKGSSWRRTRLNFEPCESCVYRMLCPSPSNYEIVFNRMNLCTI